MRVPLEILEHILLKCDGMTLLTARESCSSLRNIIDHLGKKTRLWEWCVKEEIPPEQLVEYLPSYDGFGREKWNQIYLTWSAWENYTANILAPLFRPNKFKKISSIAVSADHIAVGSEDGRLMVFTRNWQPIFEYRIVAVRLTQLTFIGHRNRNHIREIDICLVVAFHKGISIVSFDGIRKYQDDILDVKSHSVFGNHVCIEKVGGRMTIMKITDLDRREVKEIWFTRIYSPRCITSFKIWNGKCTFLINGTVWRLNYAKPDLTPMDEMEKVVDVKFYAPLMLDKSTTQIMRDNVIINIYKNADKSSRSPDVIDDYVEIIIIGPDRQYSKKLFNMWETLRSNITCIFLYGNSFVIGTDCGTVYFYSLKNWKNFDLKRYSHKQIVGKHPIIGIAAWESDLERKFYVCSQFAIHEIIVWIPLGIP